MNTFGGNITLETEIEIPEKIEFDLIPAGNLTYFVMGTTDFDTSASLVEHLGNELQTKITQCDISISTEDKIDIMDDSYELGIYECVSFEGSEIQFDDVVERFEDAIGATVVREAEDSKKFGNKIVKVDFLF